MNIRSVLQSKYIFHLLFWAIFLSILLNDKQPFRDRVGWSYFLLTFLIHNGLMALLIYGSTIFLFPRLEKKKSILTAIAGILFLIVMYGYLRSAYDKYLWGTVQQIEERNNIHVFLLGNMIAAVWFLLISAMLYISQKWFEQKQQVRNIQITELQNELKYLRAQMNPHFLFNGLNTIYGYIDTDSKKAKEILLQFSSLLRYNLYDTETSTIEIAKEMLYLGNYIALQKARNNQFLKIDYTVDIQNNTKAIAPLLFIPFVENAFKFVGREEGKENYIFINVSQKENNVEFICKNTYEKSDKNAGGIGLQNVKRRLDLIYPKKYSLQIVQEKELYQVNLILSI